MPATTDCGRDSAGEWFRSEPYLPRLECHHSPLATIEWLVNHLDPKCLEWLRSPPQDESIALRRLNLHMGVGLAIRNLLNSHVRLVWTKTLYGRQHDYCCDDTSGALLTMLTAKVRGEPVPEFSPPCLWFFGIGHTLLWDD